MDWINNIAGITKVPIKFFAVFFFVCTALILANQIILEKLHLAEFMKKYGSYVSVLFLVSGAILLVEGVINIWPKIIHGKIKRVTEKLILKNIQALDSAEASVIRELLFDGNSTAELPIDNPIVAALLEKRILKRVGEIGHPSVVGLLFPVRLTDFARKSLKVEHIGLAPFYIDNPEKKFMVTDSGIEWIRSNRPSFIHEIERFRALREGRLF
ncbi:MAG: hypothetical protein D3906_09100 [Candidatus Electrothrix sp. AUS1_2]|nr:hypothetical protein [Candidatus Electrothrix sp. AUS1_2]